MATWMTRVHTHTSSIILRGTRTNRKRFFLRFDECMTYDPMDADFMSDFEHRFQFVHIARAFCYVSCIVACVHECVSHVALWKITKKSLNICLNTRRRNTLKALAEVLYLWYLCCCCFFKSGVICVRCVRMVLYIVAPNECTQCNNVVHGIGKMLVGRSFVHLNIRLHALFVLTDSYFFSFKFASA